MKKVFAMMVMFGVAAAFMAGCGEEKKPETSLDSLKKSATKTAADAKATGDKAATDASKTADKAAADAKKAAADLKK